MVCVCARVCGAMRCWTPSNGTELCGSQHTSWRHRQTLVPQPPVPLPQQHVHTQLHAHTRAQVGRRYSGLALMRGCRQHSLVAGCDDHSAADALQPATVRRCCESCTHLSSLTLSLTTQTRFLPSTKRGVKAQGQAQPHCCQAPRQTWVVHERAAATCAAACSRP